MKRIYLLLLLFVAVAGNAFAQKDLELISFNKSPDTIKYSKGNNGGPFVRYIYSWGFKNRGNVAFTTGDTLMFKTWTNPSAVRRLWLPSAGIPVGDTVYFTDTVGWLTGPTGSPANFTMCDSVWFRTAGAVVSEPEVALNKKCRTVYWMADPLSVADFNPASPALVIYPNPASTIIKINYNFGNGAEVKVNVTDVLGRSVFAKNYGKTLQGTQDLVLDISAASPGLHMVELSVNNEKKTAKILVTK